MRKIFLSFCSILLLIIMLLPIFACNNQFNDQNIYRITIVTDGHTIKDASFNESSYIAALNFKKEFENWTKSNYVCSKFKNQKVEIFWDNPQFTTTDSLITSYSKAVFIKSKVIIASGFLHHNALVKAQNTILKHKVKFIFIDGDTPNSEVPKSNKKLAGLLYKAEQSGFLAGLAGAIWLTANSDQYGGFDNLKMSTYGGLDIPSVTNYMYGYYWAIQFFNNKHKDKKFQNKFNSWIKILNSNFKQNILPNIKFIFSGNQFSGDFIQGSKNSQAINDDLIRKKTNIIFPVSGPQAEDTLAALKKYTKGKIIGVDTNQQLQYPQFADKFITSAEKYLINSIQFMLWKSIGRNNNTPEYSNDPAADQIFIDDAPYRGSPDFIGISPNKAIKNGNKDIYTPLMKETKILLDKVSTGWQKVLILKKNYWINGIKKKYDPFR